MATSREQLIAEWKRRLDDAGEEDGELSARTAWLSRVRSRLYRLLLSLYGDGGWNAPDASPVVTDATAPEIEAAAQEPLAGKPARSSEQIRSVLKAVAENQDFRPPAGTASAAQIDRSWSSVAAASGNLSLGRCQSLLNFGRIECRLVSRGRETFLEVLSAERAVALELLDRHRRELRKAARGVRVRTAGWFRQATLAIAIQVAFVLLLIILVALLFPGQTNPARSQWPLDYAAYYTPLSAWHLLLGLVFVAIFVLLQVHRRRRENFEKSGKAPG